MVGRLDADTRAAIGWELRRLYADIIAEGVPEWFAEILRKLDEPSNESSLAPMAGARSTEALRSSSRAIPRPTRP
jgi:Anti-sigma factor NepR